MTRLLADGRIVEIIIAAMLCEGAALAWLHHATGRGVAPAALLPNLFAGIGLLAAMRLALGGAWWGFVSAALLAALVLHVIDLRRNWR